MTRTKLMGVLIIVLVAVNTILYCMVRKANRSTTGIVTEKIEGMAGGGKLYMVTLQVGAASEEIVLSKKDFDSVKLMSKITVADGDTQSRGYTN